MRKLFAICAAVAAAVGAFAEPAAAQAVLPGSSADLTLPPHVRPGWPGWPGYPYPRPPYPRPPYPPYPRPPQVQIRYTVQYRPGPFAPWRVYGRFASADRAQAAANWLRAYGYETDVVVTY